MAKQINIVKRMYGSEIDNVQRLLTETYNALYNSHLRRDPITNQEIDEEEWIAAQPWVGKLLALYDEIQRERIARIHDRIRQNKMLK